MTTDWEPELTDTCPEEFTFLPNGDCVQRKDIHEVEYRSLDGTQTFKGFECYSRIISQLKNQTS